MASAPDSTSAPAFRLEGAAPVTARQAVRRMTAEAYRERIAFYCERYGRGPDGSPGKPLDRKTVERWIRTGREREGGPDLPPLDEPEAMADWWRRCMANRVPVVFEFFESRGKEGAPAPVDVGGSLAEKTAVDAESARSALEKALKMADGGALGFEAALERARLAERLAFFQWQAVMVEPEKFAASVIDRRKKSWEDASGVLLRAEKEAEKIMDRSSEWAKWADVEAEVGQRLAVVNSGVRSLLVRVATKITLPAGLFDSLNRAFQAETDALFSMLASGDFGPLLELE